MGLNNHGKEVMEDGRKDLLSGRKWHCGGRSFMLWKSGFVFGVSVWVSSSPVLLLCLGTALSHPPRAPSRRQMGAGREHWCLKVSDAHDVPQALLGVCGGLGVLVECLAR